MLKRIAAVGMIAMVAVFSWQAWAVPQYINLQGRLI